MNTVITKKRESGGFAALGEHLENRLSINPTLWSSQGGEIWQLLDDPSETRQLTRSDKPQLSVVHDNVYQYMIPLGFVGNHELVATGEVMTNAPELWLELADSVCRELKSISDNRELRLENNQFAKQIIDNLEELNFLKFATCEMGNADLTAGVPPFANKILDSLRKSVSTHTVDLIFDQQHEFFRSLELEQSYSACEAGVPLPGTCRLLEKFKHQANSRTFIKNNCETDADCDEFDHLRNFILSPVTHDSQTVAWLVAVNRTHSAFTSSEHPEDDLAGDKEFGTIEATILQAAATIIATHVANVYSLREQEVMLTSTVKSLVSALDAKDPYTCGHSERVALYAQMIARKMNLDEQKIEQIYLTGLLHDIGKIGVGEQTLNHPGALSAKQFDIIKMHPHSGWAILQGIKQLEYVLTGVLFHHERIDGDGYPDNLVGDEIPLEARILSVADAYDAMTSNRPYRNGMSHEKASSILKEGCGTQWDTDIVTIFLEADDEINEIRSRVHQSVPLTRPRGSIRCSNSN